MTTVVSHTFEIRFARSAGLAAIFEEPANSFRWKGGGSLSISPQGISFAVKRGLLSLFARNQTRHVAAADLKEVYREGEALRLEFTSAERPREVVPFWAQDSAAAAEIVRLIPTSRTVELEHTTAPESDIKYDRRLLGAGFALLGVAMCLLYFLARERAPQVAPITLTPVTIAEIPAPAAVIAPATRLAPGTASFDSALEELNSFELRADALLTEYRHAIRDYENDVSNREQFARELEMNLIPRWWSVTEATLRNPWMADPELVEFRGALLAAARHWRNFLDGYARGARAQDSAAIQDAFDQLRKAESSMRLAASFVR